MVEKQRDFCSMTGVNGSCKKGRKIKLRPMWRANQGGKVEVCHVDIVPSESEK